ATPFAYSVAVDDPPLLFARTFADRLARLNIRAKGKIGLCSVSDIDWDKAEQIAVTRTPISKALQRANKDSLNMAAESLMLRSGNGEWPVTAKLMEKTLVKGFGLDPQELTVRDGSGLSRDNRVTPSAMVKVLSKMLGRKGGKLLLESLSVAGKDGTLRKRMNWICRNRVRAKTGYISKVSCLSGYVTDEKGRPVYAFSILVNDIKPGKAWKAKRLQDDICRELVRSLSDE
ncbi:MAG: D-alanyl-D-alanine carboxypeptidase/D-alanyl-D-alanine-endopeptidase, partial [Phycisphaerae bacterium]